MSLTFFSKLLMSLLSVCPYFQLTAWNELLNVGDTENKDRSTDSNIGFVSLFSVRPYFRHALLSVTYSVYGMVIKITSLPHGSYNS